jgi:chromatin remodeling complex protein RSC6
MFRSSKLARFVTNKSLAETISPKTVSQSEALKSVWAYIRANDLQSPANRRFVVPDSQLSEVIGSGEISFQDITTQISRFMISRSAPKEIEEAARQGVKFFPHL